MPQIYRVTYPNGKIYVGSDETDDIGYFGTFKRDRVAADFTPEQRKSFTVTKDILWEGDADCSALRCKENEFIRALNANNPAIGYNRNPKFSPG